MTESPLRLPFTYQRPVRFQDTDGAGVVFFANVLGFCHEAYEAALVAMCRYKNCMDQSLQTLAWFST